MRKKTEDKQKYIHISRHKNPNRMHAQEETIILNNYISLIMFKNVTNSVRLIMGAMGEDGGRLEPWLTFWM